MRVLTSTLQIQTSGRGLVSIQAELSAHLKKMQPTNGLASLFIQHTSASLLIQENADAQVRKDLDSFFSRLVKDGDSLFRHVDEGPDDMPAHVRAALTQTQLSIPVIQGTLALGTWQGVYVFEHRLAPHARRVVVTYLGE